MKRSTAIIFFLFCYLPFLQGRTANNPWASLPAEQGWKKVGYYGWFQDAKYPLVFQAEHGWQWLQPDATGKTLWYFDPAMGWLYASDTTLDNIFSVNRYSWLSHQVGTREPRRFWDFSLSDWVEYPIGFVSKPGLNGFDFAFSLIPVGDILPGGPNRDGIPPIFAPKGRTIFHELLAVFGARAV